MEVRFTPEQQAKLTRIAKRAGADIEDLVKSAALQLIDEESEFLDAVRAGVAAADRGEFIEEEEMAERVRKMLHA